MFMLKLPKPAENETDIITEKIINQTDNLE